MQKEIGHRHCGKINSSIEALKFPWSAHHSTSRKSSSRKIHPQSFTQKIFLFVFRRSLTSFHCIDFSPCSSKVVVIKAIVCSLSEKAWLCSFARNSAFLVACSPDNRQRYICKKEKEIKLHLDSRRGTACANAVITRCVFGSNVGFGVGNPANADWSLSLKFSEICSVYCVRSTFLGLTFWTIAFFPEGSLNPSSSRFVTHLVWAKVRFCGKLVNQKRACVCVCVCVFCGT